MKKIANLLFEARMLKMIPRSGYAFLGAGSETVAEHSFMVTFIAHIMVEMKPDINALKLITMCLIHDLPEARIGDLNSVQKQYVTAHENHAMTDAFASFPFGESFSELITEFNEKKSIEARLAHDADQLAFILDLKALKDNGHKTSERWLTSVIQRLKTDVGKSIAESILKTDWDEWWQKDIE